LWPVPRGSCTRTPSREVVLDSCIAPASALPRPEWVTKACRRQAEWVRIGRRSAAADSRPALPLRQRAHLPSQGHQVEVGQIFSIEESELASAMLDSKQSEVKIETSTVGRRFGFIWARQEKVCAESGDESGSWHRSARRCSREWRKSGLSRSVFGQLLLSARSPLCRSPGSADL